MSGWKDNAIMLWNGNKITDHGRQPLNMSTERIGTDKRMADGTLRRFFVGNKRTWSLSWENIPSTNEVIGGYKTVDGGWAGEDIEMFYQTTPGKFRLTLKRGSASGLDTPIGALTPGAPYSDDNFAGVDVMITDFSKDVSKRGLVDFWNISITLEEV